MKRLSILGSTGSIGSNALKIAAKYPERFKISVLAAANNIERLARQVLIFKPRLAVVLNEDRAEALERHLPRNNGVEILFGKEGYLAAASYERVDTVVLAMVGAAGLMPAIAAIDAGKQIALANKETLVMAGELVMERARKKNVSILPVDSEHSAIFQCLQGNRDRDFRKIFLTASGGPFRQMPLERFKHIRPGDALAHPNWEMGPKITIDSATMMNKALELLEAVHLFGVPYTAVEILVHPQSIVHSMVGFSDGAVMAQLGLPDMKGAISYALTFPERIDTGIAFPDFGTLNTLSFEAPDFHRFPSLSFALDACRQGGTLPAVMNGANEIAVQGFLSGKVNFPGIFDIIKQTMACHKNIIQPGLEEILNADAWARNIATSFLLTE